MPTGAGAAIDISFGTSDSPNALMSQLLLTTPFSLAYGGGGGSYGAQGGAGYSENPPGVPYNDDAITDLLGGSGGAMRGVNSFDINAVRES